MNRDDMIRFILDHPNIRITHCNFDSEEFIFSKENGNIYDENGYLFEDWTSGGPGAHNGLRMRAGGNWENGWAVYTR